MGKQSLGSNVEWQEWGSIDPLFGVASRHGRSKAGPNPWTDAEFYECGELDWQDFAAHWERYGIDRTSCVDIGCGAGRITAGLAKCFRTTHAVDVSKGMLDYARKQTNEASVIFHLTDGRRLPLSDNSVTAAFSSLVFQHFDSVDVGTSQFAEIFRVLKKGGTMMIQVPVYRWPGTDTLFGLLYAARRILGNLRARLRRTLLLMGFGNPFMRGTHYEIKWLYSELTKIGFRDIELIIFPTKSSNGHPYSFVLARKC